MLYTTGRFFIAIYDMTVCVKPRYRGNDLLNEYAASISAQIEIMRSLKLYEEEYTYLYKLPFLKSIISTGYTSST